MASSGASTISRWRPAVLAITGAAALGSIYYIYSSHSYVYDDEPPTFPLRRRNAIRRRRPTGETEDQTPSAFLEGSPVVSDADEQFGQGRAAEGGREVVIPDADDGATEVSSDNEGSKAEGQELRELMFAISKNRAKTDGIVHRGVTCNNCNIGAIRGIRYHCANCPDFDLCETCEALETHVKTHVFYKIRIPAPWAGKEPSPVWYPGKPTKLPDELGQEYSSIKADLAEQTGFNRSEIEGLYQQFTCLANADLVDDPDLLGRAIDRAAFNACFAPPSNGGGLPYPTLIHDRLFHFYDSDGDDVISFREFVVATGLCHERLKSNSETRKRRIFKGFDLDDDGFVSRADFVRMFNAYYVLYKNIYLEDMKARRTAGEPEDTLSELPTDELIRSGRPLAPFFQAASPQFQWTNVDDTKQRDSFGDFMPPPGTSTIDESDGLDEWRARTNGNSGSSVLPLDDTTPYDYLQSVVRDALLELLEPIFAPSMTMAVAVARSASERSRYAREIDTYLGPSSNSEYDRYRFGEFVLSTIENYFENDGNQAKPSRNVNNGHSGSRTQHVYEYMGHSRSRSAERQLIEVTTEDDQALASREMAYSIPIPFNDEIDLRARAGNDCDAALLRAIIDGMDAFDPCTTSLRVVQIPCEADAAVQPPAAPRAGNMLLVRSSADGACWVGLGPRDELRRHTRRRVNAVASMPRQGAADEADSTPLSKADLRRLANLELVQRSFEDGARKPECLSFREFSVLFDERGPDGRRLLDWLGNWLDIIAF